MKVIARLILAGCLFLPVLPLQQGSATTALTMQGNPDVVVWVNTNSGVYHCPGTRWYGNTKVGKYMKQSAAQKAGYRPAYGHPCQ